MLHRRGVIDGIKASPLCEDALELMEHTLISCYVASVIWQFINSRCEIVLTFFYILKSL